MTATLELAQLTGGRLRAERMVDDIRDRLRDATVILDCMLMVAGTASFADELIKQVLVDGHAAELRVRNIDHRSDFAEWLLDSARNFGVIEHLKMVD